jgi:hypothetical protein
LQLAPQHFVALVRRHAGLGPDVGEVGEFHGVSAIALPVRSFAKISDPPAPHPQDGA